MKKKLGRTMETTLPEELIQHIQSFMSGKEAARTTLISKSWFAAWLTRPTLDLDVRDLGDRFEEFAKKTVQRYQDSNLKIESFRVRSGTDFSWIKNLIATALKLGATDVDLELPFTMSSLLLPPRDSLYLPQEVFGSETLVRLFIYWSRLDGEYSIRCSRLKSLTLSCVNFRDREFKDLTTSCVSLEELSVTECDPLEISRVNLKELHKLRRLYLKCNPIEASFFSDFASRFPCLKDLSVLGCFCGKESNIYIASTSLETISYKPYWVSKRAEFDVPNIRKFTCVSNGLPSKVSVNGALQEWEFDIFVSNTRVPKKSWFSKLRRLVENQFKRSRIVSLSIRLNGCERTCFPKAKKVGPKKGEPKPLVVDDLRIIDTRWSYALLLRLFGVFRPKIITHCWHSNEAAFAKPKSQMCYEKEQASLGLLCRKLTNSQVISPNCGVPDQDMFGKFGLKRVNVEVMDKFGAGWRPLALEKPFDVALIPVVNKRKVRFHLIWD